MSDSDHLFRHEAGRMVAALTRVFGVHNLALAEDVVQDAFLRALETWRIHGMPDNPSAWLMTTAKNRALDVLRRQRTAKTFAPEYGRLLESEWTLAPAVEEVFAADAIQDSQLRMMFSCCHPALSEEARVALILNILCGFSVAEVAGAFVAGHSAIEKRITRAKKVLAGSKRLFDTAVPADFSARLPAVQCALYLLFNEGYHGASPVAAVRRELCHEAMRLTAMLLRHPQGAMPGSYALAALMAFSAARLPARMDAAGNLVSLAEQDRARWDKALIGHGLQLLERSAAGPELTEYHVEAAIASIHAGAARTEDTDWRAIVRLYDTLITLNASPIVALNRAIAIAQREGPERGLAAIEAIVDGERLARYPFHAAAIAALKLMRGDVEGAREKFRTALALARNPMERRFLEQRLMQCDAAQPASRATYPDAWTTGLTATEEAAEEN